jgi:hypothetical protein
MTADLIILANPAYTALYTLEATKCPPFQAHEADLVAIGANPTLAANETIDRVLVNGAGTVWLAFVMNQTHLYDGTTPLGKIWRSTDAGATWTLVYSTPAGIFRHVDIVGNILACGTYLAPVQQTRTVGATGPVDVLVFDDVTAATATLLATQPVATTLWTCTHLNVDGVSTATAHHIHSAKLLPNTTSGLVDGTRVLVLHGDGPSPDGTVLASGMTVYTRSAVGQAWDGGTAILACTHTGQAPGGLGGMVIDGADLFVGNEAAGTPWPQVLAYDWTTFAQKVRLNIARGNEAHNLASNGTATGYTYAAADAGNSYACRQVFSAGGLLYAGMYSYSPPNDPGQGPGLWVSADHGISWACVWSVPYNDTNQGPYRLFGVLHGFLVGNTFPTAESLTFWPAPAAAAVHALRVEMAGSNRLLTADVSQFASTNGNAYASGGTASWDETGGYDGGGALKFVPTGDTGAAVYFPHWTQSGAEHGFIVTAGEKLFIRMKIRTLAAWPNQAMIIVRADDYNGTPGILLGDCGQPMSAGEWTEYWAEGVAVGGDGTLAHTAYLHVIVSYPTGQGTNATIWIDDVQVSADANSWLPLSYQVGGTARTAEVVDLSMGGAGAEWSMRLLWRPAGIGWASVGVDLPIAAFMDAGGHYVEIYWGYADGKVYAKVNGGDAIAGPVFQWHQHDAIQLLYVSRSAATLYTSDPVNGTVATAIAGGALPYATYCRLASNAPGDSHGMGLFADGSVYNRSLTAAEATVLLATAIAGIDGKAFATNGAIVLPFSMTLAASRAATALTGQGGTLHGGGHTLTLPDGACITGPCTLSGLVLAGTGLLKGEGVIDDGTNTGTVPQLTRGGLCTSAGTEI